MFPADLTLLNPRGQMIFILLCGVKLFILYNVVTTLYLTSFQATRISVAKSPSIILQAILDIRLCFTTSICIKFDLAMTSRL
jgi:hypothetical protein